MEIAALGDKNDIVALLDEVHSRQQRKNPKVVQQLKERATKTADQNVKRYEHRQKDAARIAEKEQRRILAETDPDFKPPSGKNIFKTLTMRFKTTKGTKKYSNYSGDVTSFSEMTQQSTKRGVQRKILQKRSSHDAGSLHDFRVSDRDSSGNRTLRSIGGGVRNKDVLYVTNRDNDPQGIARKPLEGVFPGGMKRLNKAKSESDLLDSGFEENSNSSNNNEEEEEERPGLLYRPGMGQLSFLKNRGGIAGTLSSMGRTASYDALATEDDAVEKDNSDKGEKSSKRKSGSSDSIGTTTSLEERMKENLPWNPDEVCSDDDEDDSETSAMIRFLESCDLSHYTRLFNEQEIDLQALTLLSDEDMEKMGLKIGPRKKLQIAIKKRQDAMDNPSALTDSHL